MPQLRLPIRGECWRHYKGELYQIVGLGYDAESCLAVVVYRPPHSEGDPYFDTEPLHVRTLSAFIGSTDEHKPRFVFERTSY